MAAGRFERVQHRVAEDRSGSRLVHDQLDAIEVAEMVDIELGRSTNDSSGLSLLRMPPVTTSPSYFL